MLNSLPIITIITPTYNRKELLEKAILSVINQKKDIQYDWEMFIIDDGSIDGTKKYIQKYLDKYIDNIKYFFQENSGVGKARNVGLDNMSKNSNYLIFLDSDDELKPDLFSFFLKKFKEFKKKGEYDTVLGFYFLCEDEKGNVIGNKKILNGKNEIYFDYNSFLFGKINTEMGLITKSSIFLFEPKLRFEEDIITEGVMRSKMWQYMGKNNLKIGLFDYIGRLYNINHNGELKITKTITSDRFKKNAIGNERVIGIIGEDLLKIKSKNIYSDYLFKAGINWVLFGDNKKGLFLLKKALKNNLSVKYLIILIISYINPKLLLYIYKLYI
ncbi:glycosyltransferase [Candidatus Gracilibacteria bacterium]|nr:glycosyltransferase [Candidatus Gracilibacteria bacterium]